MDRALHQPSTASPGGNPIFAERLGGSDICMRKSAGPKHGFGWRDVIYIHLLLFTVEHTWIVGWMHQTSVALMKWLGGHYCVYISIAYSNKSEQHSGCWGFSVQIPLPALDRHTWCFVWKSKVTQKDQTFDHTRTKSTPKASISPCRNRSRKRWKTWKNWPLLMAQRRPNHGLWD